MKRVIIIVVSALMGVATASAQSGWEISAGIGPNVMDLGTSEAASGKKNPSLVLPYAFVRGGYTFAESFVGVFLNVGFTYASTTYYGGPSPLKESEPVIHVLPEVRLYYMNTPWIRLFGTLGVGVRIYNYEETYRGDTVRNSEWTPAWTLSPFGISIGEHWNFSTELGYSSGWTPARISVGYRF